VSWGDYFETVIIRCFDELMSSSFEEFISERFKPIMVANNEAHYGGVYIHNS